MAENTLRPEVLPQNGLEWVSGTFGSQPRWTIVPDITIIESIVRQRLNMKPDTSCCTQFLTQGALNKLYKIETPDGNFIMRVSLPVDPQKKTISEVATINFVRRTTSMPVAKIFAFDASSDNELGFEWILMELLPGSPLRSRWRSLPLDAKRDLVKELARYGSELFRQKFSGIGNIVESMDSDSLKKDSASLPLSHSLQGSFGVAEAAQSPLGPMVSIFFVDGLHHLPKDFSRGPFFDSFSWESARLRVVLEDQSHILRTSTDEDDIEAAEGIKATVEKLISLLSSVFPQDNIAAAGEPSVIFHDDLNLSNILVGEDGRITGIVDWECVSALPLWRASQIPKFLEGPKRSVAPQRDEYGSDEGEDDMDDTTELNNKLDSEGMTIMFWDHLMEYEQTILHDVYVDEFTRLEPQWRAERDNGVMKEDVDLAIQVCDSGWGIRRVNQWLDTLNTGGDYWSLASLLSPPIEIL